MIQKISKKLITILLIVMVTLTSFANCFGKFALTRKFYQVHDSVNIGSGKIATAIKSAFLWFMVGWFFYGIGIFLDFVILNLVEFWTDNNPVGFNEYDKDGIFVKNLKEGNHSLKLTYLNFGQKLVIDSSNGTESSQIVLLKSEPGKLFIEENGKLKEMEMSSKEVGDKTILKLAIDGKLESSKIVNTNNLNELKSRLQTNF
jgi:hypothetical protein